MENSLWRWTFYSFCLHFCYCQKFQTKIMKIYFSNGSHAKPTYDGYLTHLFIIVEFHFSSVFTVHFALNFWNSSSNFRIHVYRISMGHFEWNRACNSNSHSKSFFLRFIHHSPSLHFISIYPKKKSRKALAFVIILVFFFFLCDFMVCYECSFCLYLVYDVLYCCFRISVIVSMLKSS